MAGVLTPISQGRGKTLCGRHCDEGRAVLDHHPRPRRPIFAGRPSPAPVRPATILLRDRLPGRPLRVPRSRAHSSDGRADALQGTPQRVDGEPREALAPAHRNRWGGRALPRAPRRPLPRLPALAPGPPGIRRHRERRSSCGSPAGSTSRASETRCSTTGSSPSGRSS